MTDKTALVIVFDGVEELEALAPVDCLRRAGVNVTMASSDDQKRITGRNQIILEADSLLDDVLTGNHDLVVIPGGPGHARLVGDSRIMQLLKNQAARDGWIASICAGPMVLQAAGVLEGKSFTSFPGTAEALPQRLPEPRVVRDGTLITAQGAGCATEFAIALVKALCGKVVSDQIAESICCS